MGTLSTISSPLLPSWTWTVRSSWTTASPCFAAAWMQPPTLFSMCALSLTCLPPPYPSNQLQLSTSGMRETSMTTGLLPALPHLMILNCEQSWMGCVRPTKLVWRTYAKCMSSLTPQTCSISPWTHLITWDKTCPSPFVRYWCLGSNTIYWKVSLVGAVSSRVLDSRYSCSFILFLELFYWALIYPTYCISSMFYIIP
jgi:hypothetical protein